MSSLVSTSPRQALRLENSWFICGNGGAFSGRFVAVNNGVSGQNNGCGSRPAAIVKVVAAQHLPRQERWHQCHRRPDIPEKTHTQQE
jgi:hypothetical protein